ncbi:NADH-quinone oxidoreductase subunit A [bacterium]|jgi:NADH-quinone oxidoreductase subunit A|nr:NADH-quinone oxidoreductase subunit A [bacterium]
MEYIPVLLMIGVAGALGVIVLFASWLLGPKLPNPRKSIPFECGVPSYGSSKHRFSVRFYLVAILFLLFDVEAIFFFPWAVVYKQYLSVNAFILIEMGVFVGILLVGYYYVLRKGALEWD